MDFLTLIKAANLALAKALKHQDKGEHVKTAALLEFAVELRRLSDTEMDREYQDQMMDGHGEHVAEWDADFK